MTSIYIEHEVALLSSKQLSDTQKAIYKKIIDKKANHAELRHALKFLSQCLSTHTGQKVIILIDEYDTPLNAAYEHTYFEQAIHFFKSLLGAALKGNNALEKGIMTGILRLSKNSMLSDINNLKAYSLMEDQYSQFFGFSEDEVRRLFAESGVPLDLPAVHKWYNGYHAGHLMDIYNPWSILNCIDEKGKLDNYWIKTGGESLLKTVLINASPAAKEKLHLLITGSAIESAIDDYLSFDQVQQEGDEALWSLLWAFGYLKTVGESTPSGSLKKYQLIIPNYEVDASYRTVFIRFIAGLQYPDRYQHCLNHLIAGEVELFAVVLREFMLLNLSYFDCSTESHYHMFLLGMTSTLKESHEIYSNVEQGAGRPDLVLIPRDIKNPLGIILEFKRADKGKTVAYYEQCAMKGLDQINEGHYDAYVRSKSHIKRVLKMCMVFHAKDFVYKYVIAR